MDTRDTGLDPKLNYRLKNIPNLKRPKIIGYFSVDEHRQFVPNASQLKYFKMPQKSVVHLDLNKGIEDFQPKPESVRQEKMDFLLHFLVNNKERLKANVNEYSCHHKLFQPEVICSRGRLAQIMCSSDRNCDKWSLIVSKYKGNIYICQPNKAKAYGFKFEQFMMTENPLILPNTDVPVIESEESYCVFNGEIDNISLLYNAEMDGLASDVQVDLTKVDCDKLDFVEVKTGVIGSRILSKYCKWWSQSILARVSTIALGFRTRGGIVTEIRSTPVDMLKAHKQSTWSPDMCIHFLKSFLSHLKLILRHVDCPYTVHKFDYDPAVKKTVQHSVFEGKNEFSFLPSWFIDKINMHKYSVNPSRCGHFYCEF